MRFQQETVLRKKLQNLYCSHTWDLRRSQRERLVTDQNMDKVVVNLSSTTLTAVEKCVLSKGLNFVPTPKIPPFLDIIASTEMSLTKTEPRKAAEIKGIISSSLLQTNKFEKPNLNSMERAVIKKLKTKEVLVVTKADKGNSSSSRSSLETCGLQH
ncbi:hypothetical protein M513_08480 [Trichuris suis]|uniref:Uncharacterized protein n=1 Tax=Trichuris suis TaxID=68888 RepID=A0A085LJE1_9BILA|nr:hypothetical protein M513_14036 [Trichuris suis]KFD50673.1 hypothetical protein M513_08480 [Trichuris suis]